MSELKTLSLTIVFVAVLFVFMAASTGANANENKAGFPKDGAEISSTQGIEIQERSRTLTDPNDLTEKVRSFLGLAIGPEAFGDGNHPFTTKRASSKGSINPVDKFPWRATGKLFMKFGTNNFVCTASVIRKGLLVTAAHCVHNFGEKDAGFADSLTFEPARHGSSRPFKNWTAKTWFIPKVYWNGKDKCTVKGVVCENDIAVVVVNKKNGEFIGDAIGMYNFKEGNFGYADFKEEKMAQLTQLGYPSKDFDGDKMIRTDSIGYQDDPNNVIIGSNQTGGSSGGPWIQNFGVKTSFRGTAPTDNESNQVVGTTSWGFTSGTKKVQGASRFSTNRTYTIKSNIQSLVDSACGANPDFC